MGERRTRRRRTEDITDAVNLGVVGGTTTDKNGKARDAQPDAGAYER